MMPAAMPIRILTLRDKVESLNRAKPTAAENAMMELLLMVRRRVAARKNAGHIQMAVLRARWKPSRDAMAKRKPRVLGWRKSSSPRRRSAVAGRYHATRATRQAPETNPFMMAAPEFSGGPSRRINQ